MKKLLLILVMVLLSQTATAELTMKQFLKWANNPNMELAAEMYLSGFFMGQIFAANKQIVFMKTKSEKYLADQEHLEWFTFNSAAQCFCYEFEGVEILFEHFVSFAKYKTASSDAPFNVGYQRFMMEQTDALKCIDKVHTYLEE